MRAGQSRPNAGQSLDGSRRVAGFAEDPAGIGHLAASFEIKRCARENDVADLARSKTRSGLTRFVEQSQHGHARCARGRIDPP